MLPRRIGRESNRFPRYLYRPGNIPTMRKREVRVDDMRLLEIADAVGLQNDLSLSGDDFEKVITKTADRLRQLRNSDIMVHGRRAETMFGFLAASLRNCRVVKREDSGDALFAPKVEPLIPDYRLLLTSGIQLLVEVKNCHSRRHEVSVRTVDLDRLKTYADLFSTELRVAIYWSKWRLWTLVRPEAFIAKKTRSILPLTEALRYNSMADLGDATLATTPPITFRVRADPTHPRKIEEVGKVAFTIGSVQLFAGRTEVTDKNERSLLFYLMMYGSWIEIESEAEVRNGELEWVDFVVQPQGEEEDEDDPQPFRTIGSLSTMIANRYNELTTSGSEIQRLSPPVSPHALSRALPGKVEELTLPLWVFRIQAATPNKTDV
jgi:hypothetical protein